MKRKGSFDKVIILALICLIVIGSVSLDTVFSYFSDKTGTEGSTTMGYIELVSLTNLDGSEIGKAQTLDSDQTFTGEYKLITNTNINYYVYIFLKGTITPDGDKTHDSSCSDYYADDTDCLDITVNGYSKLDIKADGYTIYYKLCTIQTAGQNTQTFSISASIKIDLVENGCDYYDNATILFDMKVKTKQADYLQANEYTLGFSSPLVNKDLCSIGMKELKLYTRVNASGIKDNNGDYILFGYYPTTIKASGVTVGTTTDDNGYYTGSDGAKYAKLTGNPYGSSYTFSNGDTITKGTEYYFKVEQIKWRILSESNGTAMLLCESVIDACAYWDSYDTARTIDGSTVYQNNYKESRIRAWLNGYSYTGTSGTVSTYSNNGFLQIAFSDAEQNIIQTTEVDNSASTTDSSSNSYACANTNDKVYLLSYKDLINTAYGFSSSTSSSSTRYKQTTDYARANYAYTSTETDYLGNGWWWSRSPSSRSYRSAWGAYDDGDIDYYFVGSASGGVVPALTIVL